MPYFFFQTMPPLTLGEAPQKVNALLFAEQEWNQLKYNLQWKEHEKAAVAAALAKRENIRKTSDKLKQNWRDTVVNIRQKQLEAREARFEADMAERMERFHEGQREKAEERRLYLESCERLRFYTNDDVKELNNAMVLSETLRERQLQVEFEKKLQDIEDAREAEYAAKVKRDVEEYEEEERQKKEEHLARMKKNQAEILEQLREREEHTRIEKETNQKLEREDMENLRREMELGKKLEREALEKYQEGVRKNVLEALEIDRAGKDAKKIEEDEEDRVIAVYAEAKKRIADMCKKRTKEIQDEAVRQREKIKEKLGAEAKKKEDDENERIRRAVEERDAAEERVRQEKAAYQKRMVEELHKNHQDYLEVAAKKAEEEKQIKKWEMLQRFKADEVNEEFARELERRGVEKLATRREELDAQVHDLQVRRAQQSQDDLVAMERAYWKKEDQAFFKYADQILEESKQVGRPLLPIERVVHDYKKRNNLLPRKNTVQENKEEAPKNKGTKKTGRRHKKPTTPPAGTCSCGPILCTCPPLLCACRY